MATFEPHGAQVDVEASVVRVADQSWPFELDPASGDARLLLTDARGGAGAFWLRPLHWREKITLARFVHLGPAFLSRQLLRLTARGDGPLPDDPARAAALSALAAWINDPMGDGVSLPLDPLALARAVLGVCRGERAQPRGPGRARCAGGGAVLAGHPRCEQHHAAWIGGRAAPR